MSDYFYRLPSEQTASASGLAPLDPDGSSFVFYLRVNDGGESIIWVDNGVTLAVQDNNGTTFTLSYNDAGDATQRAVGEWVAIVIVNNGESNIFINGVLESNDETVNFAGNPVLGHATGPISIDIVGAAYITHALTPSEIAAHTANGFAWDLLVAGGGWLATGVAVLWDTLPVAGVVANTGTGGSHGLTLSAGAWAVPIGAETATTSVARIGSIGKYPPVRTFYRTTGAGGSYFREAGTGMSRLAFPLAGGLGTFTWRQWIRRPLTPVTAGGTIGQFTAGASKVTVGLDATEHPFVTITDGTITVTDTSPDPIAGFTWYQMTLLGNSLYIGSLLVAEPDFSTLTFPPDIETGMSFTVGTKSDGTVPLDVDFSVVAGFPELLTQPQIEALSEMGWTFDVRNPTPEVGWEGKGEGWQGPWVDPVINGVVPNAEDNTNPLVPFIGSSITEPSEYNAWCNTTSTIAVQSSAWWNDLDPTHWGFAYTTPSDEDIYGPVPTIVAVSMRADGTIILHLSRSLYAEAWYTVSAPLDLAEDQMDPQTIHGCGASFVAGSDQQANVYQELLPPGPIWETENDPTLKLLMEALAQEASRTYDQTAKIVIEGNPATTIELVPEWELVFGLPDDCAPPPLSLLGRQTAIAAAFLARGGQTVGYYLSLLEQVFGVSGTIQENWVGGGFVASDGTDGSPSGADDLLWGVSDAMTWQITMSMVEVQTQEQADRIECLFNRIKPSHTNVVFNYVGPGDVYPDVTVFYQRIATGEATATLPTIVWLGFWMRVAAGGAGEVPIKIGARNVTIADGTDGFTVDMAGSDFVNVVEYAYDTWHFFSFEFLSGVTVMYINYFARQWDSTGTAISGVLTFFDACAFGYGVANIIGFNRNLSDNERSALHVAGRKHDARDAYGFSWAGETPTLEWINADVAGVVANIGSGGVANLTFSGDTTSEES